MQDKSKMLPETPPEEMWGELPRDIVMWMDMHEGSKKTPRNLFKHLERLGREIPQWLKDEPEMKNLDSVPSKGTRAVIIYKAMWHAFEADKRVEPNMLVNSGALQMAINSLDRGTQSQKEIALELMKTVRQPTIVF